MNTTTPTTLAMLRAAHLVLDHAWVSGLPMPFTAAATEHRIDYGFASLADLAAWSTWLDEPIDDHVSKVGDVHHRVDGVALEQKVSCWHITHATRTAPRASLSVVAP